MSNLLTINQCQAQSFRNCQAQGQLVNFIDGLRMTQGYQLDHSLSQRLLKHFFDNVLLQHVRLIRVLLFSLLLSRRGHTESLLLFGFSCQRPLSCFKVGDGWPMRFWRQPRVQIPSYLLAWTQDLELNLSIYLLFIIYFMSNQSHTEAKT